MSLSATGMGQTRTFASVKSLSASAPRANISARRRFRLRADIRHRNVPGNERGRQPGRPYLSSCRGRLNVRCPRGQIAGRVQFVNLRLNISSFIHESGGHLGVLGSLCNPKQNRRLTHEILFSDHCGSPWYPSSPEGSCRSRGLVPGKCTKVNLVAPEQQSQIRPLLTSKSVTALRNRRLTRPDRRRSKPPSGRCR